MCVCVCVCVFVCAANRRADSTDMHVDYCERDRELEMERRGENGTKKKGSSIITSDTPS